MKAEAIASNVSGVIDRVIDFIIDPIVPEQPNRKKIRTKIIEWTRYVSRPMSEKVDELIERDIITTPNVISVFRALILGPLFLIFTHFDIGFSYQMGPLLMAFISDYVDGVLARKMKLATELGAGIDAACDKIFALFVALSYWSQFTYWTANAISLGLLEITLFTLGWLVYRVKKHGNYQGSAEVKANWLGKIKFNLEAGACYCWMNAWTIEGHWFLLGANIFALGSLVRHLSPKLKNH